MGAGKSIMQGEDSKNTLNVGKIDTSGACKNDIICPPIDNFTNKYQDYNIILVTILILLLFLIFFNYIIK